MPIDSLVVTFVPSLARDIVLCCGLPSETLARLIGNSPGLLRLGPESIPEPLRATTSGIDFASLNFLVGEHEPAELSRMRSARRGLVLAVAIIVLGLLTIGAYLREREAERVVGALQKDVLGTLDEAGVTAAAEQLRSPNFIRELTRTHSRLLATRGPMAVQSLPPEASIALEALLRAWPKDIETRTNRISINEQNMSVAAEVSDQAGASALGKALSTLSNWELQPPQMTRSSGGGSGNGGSGGATVQLSASLKRSAVREAVR